MQNRFKTIRKCHCNKNNKETTFLIELCPTKAYQKRYELEVNVFVARKIECCIIQGTELSILLIHVLMRSCRH